MFETDASMGLGIRRADLPKEKGLLDVLEQLAARV